MNRNENVVNVKDNISDILEIFTPPVLIVSTVVGRGIYSIGEATQEYMMSISEVYHVAIEEMLSHDALNEDYKRYRFISNRIPFLLNFIYKVPIFYYRKFIREKYLRISDVSKIRNMIDSLGIKTVICTSHRPAFWLSNLKSRLNMDFELWGILSEFGRSLGWKYIFWDVMDGYLSPVDKSELDFPFSPKMRYIKTEPPCKRMYYSLANVKADKDKVLCVAGHWGQIFVRKARSIVNGLLKEYPNIKIFVVCGKNDRLRKRLYTAFERDKRIIIYGEVESLFDLMKECSCIITKPGIATILEAHAAQRKVFLLKGMPVAEDNNARYAIANFGAQWFNNINFKDWYDSQIS